jgi:hypothetical protein
MADELPTFDPMSWGVTADQRPRNKLAQALAGFSFDDPYEAARRAGLNVPPSNYLGSLARALMEYVGPQADVAGMVQDAGAGNRSLMQGDYLGALGNYGTAAAAIPMMALPGTVADIKKGTHVLTDPTVTGRAKELREKLLSLMPDADVRVKNSGSAAGDSSYVSVYYKPAPGPGKYVGGEFRVSDHGIGERRAGDYLDLINARGEPYDATKSIERLLSAYQNLKGQK